MSVALLRLKRDFEEVKQVAEECCINIEPINDSLFYLRGEICGPPNTPYEGGKYKLKIKVPEEYPFLPPKVIFLTRVWHPNIVSVDGDLCVDILKDKWTASMTLRTVLLSIQSLLASPNAVSPLEAYIGAQYMNRYDIFLKTAKHWCNVYAGGPHKIPDYDAKVESAKKAGVHEDYARYELSKYDWNMERAKRFFEKYSVSV